MKIVIKNKYLEVKEVKELLVSHNVNTYQMDVEFNESYLNRQLYIYFKNGNVKKFEVVGPDNKVNIPHEVLENIGKLYIGAFSPNEKDNTLLDRYCTNFDSIDVIEGAYDKDATPSEELTPTILEKYLQEMKNFYNESLEGYNTNAINKTEEFNKNYEDKIKSYNDNSIQKTNEYNKNADKRIEEINNKVSDIEKIEDNIEQIQKNVQTSEQNAKDSEISAQNSAKKASEIETNIISIQEDINASKSHIDSQKENIDNSVENVEKLVDEATNQANISKEQAEISTTNATQTSADRTAVETIKDDVSSMKTSVEQTKTDTEKIKADTQAIKDDTEALKEETLQAKEDVENSLENERIISDKRYARAIDSEVIEIDNFGQVEVDQDGYMKDIEIESTLPEITQDTRKGYNKFNIDTIVENKYIYANNSNTDPYYGKLNNSNISNTSDYIAVSENTNYLLTYDYDTLLSDNERGYCFYDENKAPIVIDSIVNTLYSVTNKKATFIAPTSAKYLRFSYDKNCNNIQLIEGTEEKPYEEYGASPSLNYPSEFKNIKRELSIINNQENYFNTTQIANKSFSDGGLSISTDENGIFTVNGTHSEQVQINFNNLNFNVKQGQKLKLFKISGNISQSDNILNYMETLLWTEAYKTIALLNCNNNSVNYTDIINRVRINFFVPSGIASVTYDNFKFGIMVVDDESIENYVPYNGYSQQIALPENKFLGNFNGYENYIKDNKLKSNLKIIEFDGTENWGFDEVENKFSIYNTGIKPNALYQICTHFKTYNEYANIKGTFSLGNGFIRMHNDNNMSLEEWKNFLAQQKEAGTPLQILYIASDEETELEEINLPLYKSINNISAEDLKMSFKQNMKAIAERAANNRYARALKTKVEDVEQTQIYAENPEVENLVIKGAELTQKTREGYNFLKYPYTNTTQSKNGIDFTDNGDGSITMNGTATDLANFACQFTNKVPNDSNYTFIIFNLPTDCYANCYSVGPKYGEEVGVYNYLLNPDKTEINLGLEIRVPSGVTVDNITIYPMLVKGKYTRENIPSWEQYGASPSLDYPSEVEITKEQKISIFRKNILDTSKLTKDGTNLAVSFEPKSDGGIKIYGTANNTWVSFRKQTLNVPIKQGTTIYSNYGKTEELMRDNNDIRPFFWFYDKDDKIMNANLYGSDFKVLPKDVYSIQFGIEHFNNGTTYDEDMYIELEISDKRPTQFQKYEVTDLSIALENGFNGALKNYYNEIKKLDGKWFLLNKFAHYVLDGTSSGKKVTAKQSKNNIDKYDVLLGTDKIYIDVSKDYWKPNLGICNYLKNDKTYGSIVDENNTNYNRITFWKSGQDQMSFSTEKDRFASIDEANAYLKQLYDAGKPLEFYVLMSEDNYETIELPEDIQKELNKFKLYDDLNNVFIDKGSLSFKYNKSLLRAFEEQSELSASLLERIQALEQAQVNQVGGN